MGKRALMVGLGIAALCLAFDELTDFGPYEVVATNGPDALRVCEEPSREPAGVQSQFYSVSSNRDFDGDGVNDRYLTCLDGTVLAELSTNPAKDAFPSRSELFYEITE